MGGWIAYVTRDSQSTLTRVLPILIWTKISRLQIESEKPEPEEMTRPIEYSVATDPRWKADCLLHVVGKLKLAKWTGV